MSKKDSVYKFEFHRQDGTPWRIGDVRKANKEITTLEGQIAVALRTLKSWSHGDTIDEAAIDDLLPHEFQELVQAMMTALGDYFRQNH